METSLFDIVQYKDENGLHKDAFGIFWGREHKGKGRTGHLFTLTRNDLGILEILIHNYRKENFIKPQEEGE